MNALKALTGFNNFETLLYKASIDGFSPSSFHFKVDGKSSTLSIIKSDKNNIFGGYISIPWASSGIWQSDSNSFLFSLVNPQNIAPFKVMYDSSCIAKNGGSGGTLFINYNYHIYFWSLQMTSGSSNGINNEGQYSNCFPGSYTFFDGSYDFVATDIEVWKVG